MRAELVAELVAIAEYLLSEQQDNPGLDMALEVRVQAIWNAISAEHWVQRGPNVRTLTAGYSG